MNRFSLFLIFFALGLLAGIGSAPPAGAVLIAGGLGSVFKPLAGPTGWYWIGTSPLRQWFPEKDPPLLIHPGDRVIYRPVEREEFERIQKRVEKGTFAAQVTP